MALNATKTNSMLVLSPQRLNILLSQSLNVAINDSNVEQVTMAKILRLTLDHTLSWEGHIETLCKKLNRHITLLRRIQPYLTQVGSLHYYNACIHSQLVYCSSVWGTRFQTLLPCLLHPQKPAARIILQADCSAPSVSLFSTLHWIPVCDIIKYKKLQLLFSILLNPEAPLSLKEKFSFVSANSAHMTRGATSGNLVVPQPRTNSGKCTFSFSAAILLMHSPLRSNNL